MPDVPVVVLSAGIRSDMDVEAVVKDSLLLAHQHMVSRFPQGRLVIAENGSHTTLLSYESELIVDSIKSILRH